MIVKAVITHYDVKPKHIFEVFAKCAIPCNRMLCMEMPTYLACS